MLFPAVRPMSNDTVCNDTTSRTVDPRPATVARFTVGGAPAGAVVEFRVSLGSVVSSTTSGLGSSSVVVGSVSPLGPGPPPVVAYHNRIPVVFVDAAYAASFFCTIRSIILVTVFLMLSSIVGVRSCFLLVGMGCSV